eukprot:6301052-Lingulodinium_polyedra.AAC.1
MSSSLRRSMGAAARLSSVKSLLAPAVAPEAQHFGPALRAPAPGRIAGASSQWPRSRAVRTASKWRSSPLKPP